MKILIVVDMQNDFVEGSLGTPEARAIVPNVKALTEDSEFDRIFYTQDTHNSCYLDTFEGKKLPIVHCVKGTKGWEIIPELCVKDWEVIEKPTFGSDELVSEILQIAHDNPIEEIEFCGLLTDVCVISNALMVRAALPNTKISINYRCCAASSPEAHEAALLVAKSCQIDVIE